MKRETGSPVERGWLLIVNCGHMCENMLTAKFDYNHYTQTTQFSQSTLSKAPPPSAARTDTFFHIVDVFFVISGGMHVSQNSGGLVTL